MSRAVRTLDKAEFLSHELIVLRIAIVLRTAVSEDSLLLLTMGILTLHSMPTKKISGLQHLSVHRWVSVTLLTLQSQIS